MAKPRRVRHRILAIAAMSLALHAASAPEASAQTDRPIDLSGGYINVMGTMHGANIQLSTPLGRRWSVFGEFNRAEGPDCSGCEPNYRDWSALAGLRYAWQPTPRLSPFWQFAAGALHSSADSYYEQYCCNLGRQYQEGYSINYLALQPGGGVTYMVTPRIGLRVQGDLQLAIPDQSEWEGMSAFPRVVTGVVLRLGR